MSTPNNPDNPDTPGIDAETIQQLVQEEVLFGCSFRKTNADGSWTRIAPEDVYMPVPPDCAPKSVEALAEYLRTMACVDFETGLRVLPRYVDDEAFRWAASLIDEGQHYRNHFTALAKVNPAADHALDTARREWEAKKGGK